MEPTTYALRRPLALTRSVVDRAGERRRDARWLAAAWADHRTRVLVIAGGAAPVADGHLVLVSPSEAPDGERFLLGVDTDGIAYFAVALAEPHPDSRAVGLRRASLNLDDRDGGLLVHAIALANWHATHGYCSRCGAPTEVAEAGHLRRCPEDGSEHYPRTDPVIIVLVMDDADRCLLGRHPDWPEGRYSTLAGFVEPGETPEQAVVREVREETGISVSSSWYAGSQPWPFPSNLMLGFYGRAQGEDPKPDGHEISDARWFSRTDLAAAVESRELIVPPSVAISRGLIEGWYGSELPVTH